MHACCWLDSTSVIGTGIAVAGFLKATDIMKHVHFITSNVRCRVRGIQLI